MMRRMHWPAVLAFFFGALFFGARAAHADDHADRVHFGHNIVVQNGEEAHDTVCFLCSIEIDGTVHGDAVAFLGRVTVRGHAERDVVSFLGGVDVGEGATIGRDCVVFAGNLHTSGPNSIGRDSVVFPFFIFLIPIGFLIFIIWLVVHLIRRNRVIYPPPPGYLPQR